MLGSHHRTDKPIAPHQSGSFTGDAFSAFTLVTAFQQAAISKNRNKAVRVEPFFFIATLQQFTRLLCESFIECTKRGVCAQTLKLFPEDFLTGQFFDPEQLENRFVLCYLL